MDKGSGELKVPQGLRGLYWEWLLLLERKDLFQPQPKRRQLFKITQPPTQLTLSFTSSRLNSSTTRLVLRSHKLLFRSPYAVLRSNTVETLKPDVEWCLSTGAWGALPGEQDKKPSFSLTSLLFKGHMNCLHRDQPLRVQCGRQALSPYRGTFKTHASSQFVNRIYSMMAGARASLRPPAHFFPHLLCQTMASSPNVSFHQELTTLHGTEAPAEFGFCLPLPSAHWFPAPCACCSQTCRALYFIQEAARGSSLCLEYSSFTHLPIFWDSRPSEVLCGDAGSRSYIIL